MIFVVLLVDRLSGFVGAWAVREVGLTGKKVATKMLERWEIVGVPRLVVCDKGPQFVSTW